MKQENFEIKDIYPNPAQGYFTFTFISGSDFGSNNLKVSICSTDGLQMLHKEYDNLVTYSQYTFKTEQLGNGIYDVIFDIEEKQVKQQIIVLK